MANKKRKGKYRRISIELPEDQLIFLEKFGQETYRSQSDSVRFAVSQLQKESSE